MTLNSTQFRAWLVEHVACQGALDWLGDRDAATAWAECPRGDWLLWWAGKAGAPIPRELLAEIVELAVASAAPDCSGLGHWMQVRSACEQVAAALRGTGDLAAARVVAWAAEAAAWAAARAAEAAAWAAARAARAAAWAAWAAARAARAAAWAAWAAEAAAEDAAWAAWAAEDASRAAGMADLVRRHVPMPVMEEA